MDKASKLKEEIQFKSLERPQVKVDKKAQDAKEPKQEGKLKIKDAAFFRRRSRHP